MSSLVDYSFGFQINLFQNKEIGIINGLVCVLKLSIIVQNDQYKDTWILKLLPILLWKSCNRQMIRLNEPSYCLFTSQTRGRFHQHAYEKFEWEQIPKAQKDSLIIGAFLCFWDLHTLKLPIRHWWNWLHWSISLTFYELIICTKVLWAAFL